MKKILVLFLICLLIFFIYLSTIDRKVYFLTLSSNTKIPYIDKITDDLKEKNSLEKYIKDFNKDKYRITDYINMIDSNKNVKIKGKNQSIKNALIKSDVIVLEVGYDDIYSKTVYKEDKEAIYDYIDEVNKDMNELLNKVRLYSKEDIFLIIKTNNKLIEEKLNNYMLDKLKVTSHKYNVETINVDINEIGAEEKLYTKLKSRIFTSLFNK